MQSQFPRRIITGIIILAVVCIVAVVLVKVLQKKPEPVITKPVEVSTEPKYEVIGTSVQGRHIESYTYGSGPTKLLFVGGTHGGYEWNSVLLAYQFMDYLKANPGSVPSNESITIIPSLNPDGDFKVIGKEG